MATVSKPITLERLGFSTPHLGRGEGEAFAWWAWFAVQDHTSTMLIWFVRRIFMFFGFLGIVCAQKIEPAGRRAKRFVEKTWFCWHLTRSVTHPTRSLGHLDWRHGCLTNWRMCLSKWCGCLLKSRRHRVNRRGHLWAVCRDLTPVGGHLSPVDAGSTAVEAGLAKVNTA